MIKAVFSDPLTPWPNYHQVWVKFDKYGIRDVDITALEEE